MTRQVNAAGLAIAALSEGTILHTYLDAAGVPTIGTGHTGPDAYPGRWITNEQDRAWLASDMARASAYVEGHVKVLLNDNQFSALTDFTFNVGTAAFLGSTLLRNLNKGQYDAVPDQLKRWNKARVHGKKQALPGLTARRLKEIALWLTPPEQPHPTAIAIQTADHPPDSARPAPPSIIETVRSIFHRKTPAHA